MNRSVLDWPAGVTVYHPDRCYNGYTLVHGRGPWDPVRGISAEQVDRWHLIDMKGEVVHEFYGNPATQRGSQLFERVANGHYISNGASIIEQDWDGNIVWSLSSDFRVDARPTGFHHDIQKTSEHTYLAMVADRVDAPQVSRVTLKDDHILEITSEGEIIWEWWGHHHLEEFGFSDRAKQIIFETGGGQQPRQEGDWLHLNTLHTLPDNPLYDQGYTRFKLFQKWKSDIYHREIDWRHRMELGLFGPDGNYVVERDRKAESIPGRSARSQNAAQRKYPDLRQWRRYGLSSD
ncbi:MAG: aryl-sulfate sulfotransferase [Candidatus Latescibacteria bacterium]|nr:aryl-sulfate sulfotransferase [Candidatus Latescibacterota bacterium]